MDQDQLVVVLNNSTATKVVDVPLQPIGAQRAEGALRDAFNVDARWSIANDVLREVKLPPRSGLVLI